MDKIDMRATMNFAAQRVSGYGDSIFDEINLLAQQHQAVNLGSGQVNMEEPPEIIAAAQRAIVDGRNQYALGRGELELNEAIAAHAAHFYGQPIDPASEVTVTSGVTEGLWSAAQAFIETGDEVIVFEPFYEPYVPAIRMSSGRVVPVTLHAPDFRFDPDELRAAFSPKTKAILINTPHNPTGTVLNYQELALIAELCQTFDAMAWVDEVYEHIVFDDNQHHRLATFPDMWARTLTFSGASKTFSATGWRIGWVIGPNQLQEPLRVAHQFAVFCSPTPFQYAIAEGLKLPPPYFEQLSATHQARRDFLLTQLEAVGLRPQKPQGGYFIMTDIRDFPHTDAVAFCRYLIADIGVAAIPPAAFYINQHLATQLVRFTFCKPQTILEEAVQRLVAIQAQI